ncbi:hypothetical protein MKL09_05125 [Methylobacterium sp. J-048]|uniref:ribbon-helix-helix domain-containing protein n=1 Tax=Methylobacterium sp. J-048 TaxID=2836635 RepID=UPI001FB91EA0|nr:ribbon-helix-helix domain-containing protein [Methylobacterium sp. J-048]MCJ2055931.1 hypothetical protein [Methylobacterium sp. J-048]
MPSQIDETTDQPTGQRASTKVRNMQVRVNPKGFQAVKILTLELEMTLEDLMVEALNDFLAKHGKPATVERRSPDRASSGETTMRGML